jgi:hypothetical protein
MAFVVSWKGVVSGRGVVSGKGVVSRGGGGLLLWWRVEKIRWTFNVLGLGLGYCLNR